MTLVIFNELIGMFDPICNSKGGTTTLTSTYENKKVAQNDGNYEGIMLVDYAINRWEMVFKQTLRR